jgi:hypothetical protein
MQLGHLDKNKATAGDKKALPVEMAWVVLGKSIDLTPTPSDFLALLVSLVKKLKPLLLYINKTASARLGFQGLFGYLCILLTFKPEVYGLVLQHFCAH